MAERPSLTARLLRPIVQLRDGESTTALLMFLFSFLAMTSYNIIKPITRSEFISSLGADNLPYVQFGAGVRADLVEHRRTARGEEALDSGEILIAGPLVEAEAERLRNRRADARKHHQRAGNRSPDRARVRLAARLRIDERRVAVAFGCFKASRERRVREHGTHRRRQYYPECPGQPATGLPRAPAAFATAA